MRADSQRYLFSNRNPKNETQHHLCPNRKIGYTSGYASLIPGLATQHIIDTRTRLSNAARSTGLLALVYISDLNRPNCCALSTLPSLCRRCVRLFHL